MKKKKEMSTDDLAIIIKKSFDYVEKRFNGIDKRFNKVEKRLDNLEIGQKEIKQKLTLPFISLNLRSLNIELRS